MANTLTLKDKLIVLLPSILLLAVFLTHIFYLEPVQDVSKWKAGGMGVYCTNFEQRMTTWVNVKDEFFLLKSALYPNSKFNSEFFSYIPYATDKRLRNYVEELTDKNFIDAQELTGKTESKSILPNKLVRFSNLKQRDIELVKSKQIPILRANTVLAHIWEYEYLSPTQGQWNLVEIVKASSNED